VADLDGSSTDGIAVSTGDDAAGNVVITVTGDLDLLAADSLREAVRSALGGDRRNVIFELSGLRFIDSAGLSVLIEASSQAASVELHSPTPAVRRAIELTGLTSVFKVVP
jgi:anti-sigma B factor antagonist